MKKNSILFKVIGSFCCVLMIAIVSLLTLTGCCEKHDDEPIILIQDLDYSDGIELTYNPDQGFYRAKVFTVRCDGIFYDEGQKSAIEYDFNHYENQLFHLRMDISAFSKENNGIGDIELTTKALDDLNELLNNLKNAQKNAVIRFCYCPDFGSASDKEPSLEMMKKHINQISSVLNKYESSITAIEAGMIGRWGEMNGSAITKDSAVVNEILGTWLSCTNSFPILTRQPQHIYDFLGLTYEQAMNYNIEESDKAYRLGIFDDSYLGSESDLGTFNHNRSREIEWISKQTSHLPFGGEASYSSEEKSLHRIEDRCLENMNTLNLSYLNYHYNNNVTDYWKSQTYSAEMGSDSAYYGMSVYEYIAKHFGYRFVLNKSTFKYEQNSKLEITLQLKNVGFGNLTKTKDLQLIAENNVGEIVLRQNVGSFTGEQIVVNTNLGDLSKGEYKFYLAICSLEEDNITYPIAFSNSGLFNNTLKANYVGKIEI